ncbi:hypothetical protein ACF0H5_004647 [Mactra antiquata]
MTTFAESFWGGKNNGFYVLYHNMKHGQTSTKDLIDFLRESCQVEETYSKLLMKLAKVAANNTQVGTFAPFWNIMKSLAEKLSSLHMQLVHTWSDLIKDIVRYNEEQHKRHKSMKEGEASTLEVVQSIQNTTTALQRAKEIYHTRCLELERLKRENSSPKDIEKSETKYKKAKEEYKTLVDKYATIREDFQSKMLSSCTHFQELEEEHICQMKDFVDTYARALHNEHVLFGQAQEEFRNSCDSLSVQKLLETFIEAKSTGKEKPGPLEFVEPDLSTLPPPRPMSPDTGNVEKRDSISDRSKAVPEFSSHSYFGVAQTSEFSSHENFRLAQASAFSSHSYFGVTQTSDFSSQSYFGVAQTSEFSSHENFRLAQTSAFSSHSYFGVTQTSDFSSQSYFGVAQTSEFSSHQCFGVAQTSAFSSHQCFGVAQTSAFSSHQCFGVAQTSEFSSHQCFGVAQTSELTVTSALV